MLAYLLLVLNVTVVVLNSAFHSLLICLIALIKLLLPSAAWKAQATQAANWVMWSWASVNAWVLQLSNRVEWDIQGGET